MKYFALVLAAVIAAVTVYSCNVRGELPEEQPQEQVLTQQNTSSLTWDFDLEEALLERDRARVAANRERQAEAEARASSSGSVEVPARQGIRQRESNPLLSNIVFEVQGPLNGIAQSDSLSQYYLSSTIEFAGLERDGAALEALGYLSDAGYLDDDSVVAHEETPPGSSVASDWQNRSQAEQKRSSSWKASTLAANMTSLRVGDEDELPLLGMEATAWVAGFRARVLLDCVYENDREQQLEGDFKLRMPEGATPYYLAFGEEVLLEDSTWELPLRDRSLASGPEPESILADRTGHWKGAREARMVPRAEAARAYKDTLRKQVDPALMEWSGAGVFSTRVFPLQPKSVHRIVVGYEVDLRPLAGQLGTTSFDLEFPAELEALSLGLHVRAPEGSAIFVEAGDDEREKCSGNPSFHYPNTQHRSFRVSMNGMRAVALVAAEDRGAFAMDLEPELEREPTQPGARGAIFVVDTSLSSANGGYPVWLDLMTSILTGNRSTIDEFSVLFFDVTPRWWRTESTLNTQSAVSELRSYAESLSLEGASDIGAALRTAANAAWRGPGEQWDTFLLSDGAATWGEADMVAVAGEVQLLEGGAVFAYSTGQAGTDRNSLEQLTRETGGGLFSVAGPGAIPAAATAHLQRPWQIESVHTSGGTDLLLRGRPRTFFPGQKLRLVGRGLPRAGDVVALQLKRDGMTKTIEMEISKTLESPLAARAFGEVATAQLEELGREARPVAQAYATRYRVPGKACSLLMLETDQEYLEHGILTEAQLAEGTKEALLPILAAAVESSQASRGDSLQAFLERLDQLWDQPAEVDGEEESTQDFEAFFGGKTPQAALRFEPDFVRSLALLPTESFSVPTESLSFELLQRTLSQSEFQTEIESGEPAFDIVLEESQRRYAELGRGDAVRAIATLVELNPGDGKFAREVAQVLMEWGLPGHAYHLYLRLAESRPFEPQNYLALAHCAEQAGRTELAFAWYAVALEGNWASRFGDFTRISSFDALHLLNRIERGELQAESGCLRSWSKAYGQQAKRLAGLDQADFAVIIEWNTDSTDMDLHVVEPDGQHCYYSNRKTTSGGHLSRDVTQGYGPELFTLEHATVGEHVVYARYYSGNRNRTSARTSILCTVYTDWGTPTETVERRVLRLDDELKQHPIVMWDNFGKPPVLAAR